MIRRGTFEQMAPLVIPPEDGEAPSIYCLEAKVLWTLPRSAPEYDFRDTFDGDIVRYRLDLPPERAGKFLAIRFRTDDAHDAGKTLPEVMGEWGPWLMHFYHALYDPGTDNLKGSVRRQFGVDFLGANILLLYSVLVLHEHRGRGVGLATASRLVEILGGGCPLVACHPFPAQFSPPIPDHEFHEAMRLDQFTRDRRLATRRIRRHVRRLGFRRVGRSNILAAAIDSGLF